MKNGTMVLTLTPPCGVGLEVQNGKVMLSADIDDCETFIQWLLSSIESQIDEQLDRKVHELGGLH